jgi:hypothetical protein
MMWPGGWRQQGAALAAARSAELPRFEHPFARHLVRQWGWGLKSAAEVQREAALVLQGLKMSVEPVVAYYNRVNHEHGINCMLREDDFYRCEDTGCPNGALPFPKGLCIYIYIYIYSFSKF